MLCAVQHFARGARAGVNTLVFKLPLGVQDAEIELGIIRSLA